MFAMEKRNGPEGPQHCLRKAKPVYHTLLGTITPREVVACFVVVVGFIMIPALMSMGHLAGWW